jgi:hypothetical protein
MLECSAFEGVIESKQWDPDIKMLFLLWVNGVMIEKKER